MSAPSVEMHRLAWDALTKAEKLAFIREHTGTQLTGTPSPSGPAVFCVKRVAETLDRSTRFVHALAKQGLLRRVTIPGRKQGIGFTRESVLRLLAGGAQ